MSEQIALVTNVTAYAGLAAAVGLIEAGFRVVCHDRAFSEYDKKLGGSEFI